MKRIFLVALLVCVLAGAAVAGEYRSLWKGQVVFVPLYSHVYRGDSDRPFDLTCSLAIRNTDFHHAITVVSVDYHDESGKLVKRHLAKPVEVGALASVRFTVDESDRTGGFGAKFLVRWESKAAVTAPVIEAVMIGTKMQQGISFVTEGRVLSGTTE